MQRLGTNTLLLKSEARDGVVDRYDTRPSTGPMA